MKGDSHNFKNICWKLLILIIVKIYIYYSNVTFEETPQEVLLHWLRLFLYNILKFVKA